jgi:chromosome segregation ATPase
VQQLQEELERFFLAHQQSIERSSELEGHVQEGERLLAEVREELACSRVACEQLALGLEEQQARLLGLEEEVKKRGEEVAAAQAEGAAQGEQVEQLQGALERSRQEAAAGAQKLADRQQRVEQQQARLSSLEEELTVRGEALAAAQAKAEQLLDVQLALEQFFLAHQQAMERNIELEGRVREGEQLLADVHQELKRRDESLASAQAEGQSKGEQLHQVQEELEHYFQHNRGQAELIEQLAFQQQRALQLLKMVWFFWKGSIIDF